MFINRNRFAAASFAACATIMAVGASAAAAKTVTMHFFSRQAYSRISDASGHAISQNSVAVGDRLSFASNDYAVTKSITPSR